MVDISLKDGLFSGDTTVSDSPLVPCENGSDEFEGFVMGSLRNRKMQNSTPTSPQVRSVDHYQIHLCCYDLLVSDFCSDATETVLFKKHEC